MGQLVKCVGRADMANGRCRSCGQLCDSSGSCYSYLEVHDPPVGARAELWRGMYEQSQADLARLQARVASLEEALSPFARFAWACGPNIRDTALYLGGYDPDYDTLDSRVTGAHFKAARAALPDAGGAR